MIMDNDNNYLSFFLSAAGSSLARCPPMLPTPELTVSAGHELGSCLFREGDWSLEHVSGDGVELSTRLRGQG